jgi:hypothetical protein
MVLRLLTDENTSHRLVSACRRLVPDFPIAHIANWRDGMWLGLDDQALLICCADAGLVLVAFDRATLAWQAGQLIRGGRDHAGVILYRGTVRSSDYGHQSRLLTGFWTKEGGEWDWQNRMVYLPKSP